LVIDKTNSSISYVMDFFESGKILNS